MNTKNIFTKTLYIILISITLLTNSASASIIFESSSIDGGISYFGGSDTSKYFERSFFPSTADSGSEQLQAFNGDLLNQLTWNIKGNSATIKSTMTTIPEASEAWVLASFSFRVQGAPVNYSLETSVDMINTRFMRTPEGSYIHECLSPGCDYDHLWPGKTTGTLYEGYTYALEFSPHSFAEKTQHSEFLFQVPEPPVLIILTLAFFTLIFKKAAIENMNRVRKLNKPLQK
ncbi:hypothetical protein Ping_1522 [Psychromonas ingrahamii 37]|uniref:PEP-CTERM protein-sorting domain-containing protein n=1 Tax=Psychromonas ingrahamii (strain DSM 17664 / CCUG 51855 / 37) TaxID=357804 RepID=A1SV18_PSYIN|nr:hypothetical protein [Psychromonas ingrahamii]ABM03333.1 hypothetical protein Ping_1522 [Psychromonas ingrahamii 37]